MAAGATRDTVELGSTDWWELQAAKPLGWQAAAWGSHESQAKRFSAWLDVVLLEAGDSVLDWGCGHGDLRAWIPADVNYTGADPTPAMLDAAQRNFARSSGTRWVEIEHPRSPSVGDHDHIVAIGPFNLKPWNQEATEAVLEQLWRRTRKSLAVSVLRTSGETTAVVHSPERMLAIAQRTGARRWLLDASYLPNDLLLVMFR